MFWPILSQKWFDSNVLKLKLFKAGVMLRFRTVTYWQITPKIEKIRIPKESPTRQN
jgi:hypothetical protein